jgi:hypothetical protein
MTCAVKDTLSTGVIPAEAGTQDTEPQGRASGEAMPEQRELSRDRADRWRQDFDRTLVAK